MITGMVWSSFCSVTAHKSSYNGSITKNTAVDPAMIPQLVDKSTSVMLWLFMNVTAPSVVSVDERYKYHQSLPSGNFSHFPTLTCVSPHWWTNNSTLHPLLIPTIDVVTAYFQQAIKHKYTRSNHQCNVFHTKAETTNYRERISW